MALASFSGTAASAAPESAGAGQPQILTLTPQESTEFARQISAAAELSSTKLIPGGRSQTKFTLRSGSTVVLEKPADSGTVTPAWSIGVGWGWYLYLNQSDQRVLAQGGAAGLAVLICDATALVGCAAVTAAAVAAAAWITDRGGICTGSKKYLEIHTSTQGILAFKCVTAPG